MYHARGFWPYHLPVLLFYSPYVLANNILTPHQIWQLGQWH